MCRAIGMHCNRLSFLAALFVLLSVAGWMAPAAMAQQATANVNGVVKDPTGAAIPNAQVELTNVNTGSREENNHQHRRNL